MVNRRIIVSRYGGPEVLRLVEEPLRAPQAGEIRIKVQSAGVALGDVMRREGLFPNTSLPPFTPGYDAVGIVDEAGDGVHRYSQGDRVGILLNGTGGYSEYIYAAESDVFEVPDSVEAAEAVAVILNYVTAYQMLHRLAHVSEGDNVLVHGASGGVGTALLELGRASGLTMYGTASKAKHSIVAQYGATPIDYRKEDFVEVVTRMAPKGMDSVFDPIGGQNWRRSYQTLNRGGRFVGFGFTSVLNDGGESDDYAGGWRSIAETRKTDTGHAASVYSITSLHEEKPEWFREDVRTLFSMLEKREIRPVISHRIPLCEAGRAHRWLEDRSSSVGKVVLIGT